MKLRKRTVRDPHHINRRRLLRGSSFYSQSILQEENNPRPCGVAGYSRLLADAPIDDMAYAVINDAGRSLDVRRQYRYRYDDQVTYLYSGIDVT